MKHVLAKAMVLGLAWVACCESAQASVGNSSNVEILTLDCVEYDIRESWAYQYAESVNKCPDWQDFYFVWDLAKDGGCKRHEPGNVYAEKRVKWARFAGTKNCNS